MSADKSNRVRSSSVSVLLRIVISLVGWEDCSFTNGNEFELLRPVSLPMTTSAEPENKPFHKFACFIFST